MMTEKNNASRRPLAYWSFFLTFLLGGGPILAIRQTAPSFVHPALDGIAIFMSVIAAGVLLNAYKKTKAPVIGILAVGVAGAVAFELLHTFADSPLITDGLLTKPEILIPWTWNATQLLLSTTMLIAALFSGKDAFGNSASTARQRIALRTILPLTIVVIPATTLFLLSTNLQSLIIEARAFSRPADLVSASLFLLALITFTLKGNWRKDSYGHMFLMALIAGLCSQAFLMAFSKQLYDASFSAGHLLHLAMYACLIVGFGRAQQISSEVSESDVVAPSGLSMGAKLGILCGSIALISVMPLAIKSSSTLHLIASENGITSLSTAAETAALSLTKQRLRANGDLNYLANVAPLGKLSNAAERERGIRELSLLTRNLLLSDSGYFSVGYVDAATRTELVNHPREALGNTNSAALLRLQENTNDLITQVLSTDQQTPLARSALMRISNSNAAEQTKALRIETTAMAVYDSETGLARGVFILQSDVSRELTAVNRAGFTTQLYVVNSEGRFVVHPDHDKEVGLQGTSDYTIGDEFAGLNFVALLADEAAGGSVYTSPEGVELIVGADRLPAPYGVGDDLLYIYTGLRAEIEQRATIIGNEMQQTAQLTLLCAVILGWFFAQRLARPVKNISDAAVEFGRNGSIMTMPVDGRDEIGMLAKSLNDMMNKVNSQRDTLVLLAAAVESSVDSILISSADGLIVYANPHYERYAGVKSEDIVGLHSTELPEFHNHTNFLSEAPSKRGNEVVWTGQYQWRRADGQMHDESIMISPIRNANGEIINHSMIIQDITQRRKMETDIEAKAKELMRSNKDLEQFAYVASHDLKAPLRAIEVILEWLREDLHDYNEGDVQENLTLLDQRTSRLGRLLEDLLAYSRAGRKVGDVRQLDMQEFVEDIATLIAPPAGMQIIADKSLPALVAHHAPLETVLRNLLSNAIKHHPDPQHGIIKVSAKDQGNSVLFSVEDNGIGIPEEYAAKVFKMFQTLRPRDDCEGSGMGLAIVQRIVTWQGGRIWFRNKPDGSGIVFNFIWNKAPQDMPEILAEDNATAAEKLAG